MLKKFFTMLCRKLSSKKQIASAVETREVNETYSYWADEEEVDYSSMRTAQDVISTTSESFQDDSDDASKNEKESTTITYRGYSGGCGGGCFGGCGGGCF